MPPEPNRSQLEDEAQQRNASELQREISARKRLEEELRSSQQRWQDLVEFAPDAMIIVDVNGRIKLVNAQTETLFGYERGELLDQHIEIIIPERYHTRHIDLRQVYSADPLIRPMGHNLSLYARRKDGGEFPVDISLSPIETGDELLISSSIRDITDRKQAEEERIQREKLQAVIEMAGAATHELSQPLQYLLGHLSLLAREELPQNHPLYRDRGRINEEISKVFDILHQLNGIISYKTQDYAGISKIIDLEGAQRSTD